MATINSILDAFLRLSNGQAPSTTTFVDPEAGFGKLVALLEQIFRVVKEAETAASQEQSDREVELSDAARATRAAAGSANAAADAADAATQSASSAAENDVARSAVAAAFRASGAAFRAAAAAQYAAVAAESLPPAAEILHDGDLAKEFFSESELANNIYQLLFHDKHLQLSTSVYSQLSPLGQAAVREAASYEWDQLRHRLQQIKRGDSDRALDALLQIIRSGNTTLKALVRQYLLDSPAFRDTEVLSRVSESEHAADLGLNNDADLRARNIGLRPDIASPTGPSQCSICGQEEEVVSGKIDQNANDEFLTFPGKLNGKPLKPLIDTGGGCNLIKAEWLKAHGIEVDPDSPQFQSLLMADGSTSKKCPCIDVRWSFDGRQKAWTDVEFVVVENYKYDALIGLPFLKHTETIHNSAGKLVFPEFKGVHAKKDAIPLYNFEIKAST